MSPLRSSATSSETDDTCCKCTSSGNLLAEYQFKGRYQINFIRRKIERVHGEPRVHSRVRHRADWGLEQCRQSSTYSFYSVMGKHQWSLHQVKSGSASQLLILPRTRVWNFPTMIVMRCCKLQSTHGPQIKMHLLLLLSLLLSITTHPTRLAPRCCGLLVCLELLFLQHLSLFNKSILTIG